MLLRTLLIVFLAVQVSTADESSADRNVSRKPQFPTRQQLKNIELTSKGTLNLQVVDDAGVGLPHVPVQIVSREIPSSWKSDETGRVFASDISPGTCLFAIGNQQFACRVWPHGTAPPKSLNSIALVSEDLSLVRGNPFSRKKRSRQDYCNECEKTRCLSSEAKYGLGILALGGTAAYFALSRDNASE